MADITSLRQTALSLLLAALMIHPAWAGESDTLYEAGLEAAADFRYDVAMAKFQQAASLGHREAQCNLGLMLLLEEPRSEARNKEATHLLTQAAAQGSEVARFVLSRIGVYQNRSTAQASQAEPSPTAQRRLRLMAGPSTLERGALAGKPVP